MFSFQQLFQFKMFVEQVFLIFSLCFLADYASGHGMLFDPPNRSSLWRFGLPGEPNYTDMGINCGGFDIQYHQNGGKCGICGDNYADPIPRANEDGGIYGQKYIARTYSRGSELFIFIEMTAEHKGHFEFHLCDLSKSQETEDCFQPLLLVGGAPTYVIDGSEHYVNHTMSLQLPSDVTCDRCVLRWHYKEGQSVGVCDDGSEALGCGEQVIVRNCADIKIQ